jgi:hypothetical protein
VEAFGLICTLPSHLARESQDDEISSSYPGKIHLLVPENHPKEDLRISQLLVG